MPSASAIIVGGGVIGLNAAYQLARRRFGKIILLDKGPVGGGASSRAAGIVTGLLWSETGVEARKRSLSGFRELSEELSGYGYRFQDVGCLNLFDAESWPERERLLPLYDRSRVPYEILTGAEMRSRWPDLTPEAETVGLFDPLGGYSEPHEFIPALRRRAEDLGVEILENRAVTGFRTGGGRIEGVGTSGPGGPEEFGADVVICTVHVWTLKLLALLGRRLPIKAFVHQRYVTAELAQPIAIPAVNAHPLGGYVRPARKAASDRRLLAGFETEQRAEVRVPSLDFDMSTLSTPEAVRRHMTANLGSLVPRLTRAVWDSEHVGLLSFSSDGEPILGPVADLAGLYVAGSFHSGGFAYSPAAGQLLAELVSDGRAGIDIAAFSPQRFEPHAVDSYLAEEVTQADAVSRRH